MQIKELEQKYILTNDALCCVIMWKQEFKKQLFLENEKSENEKKKHFKIVEQFIDKLKIEINKAYNLKIE